MYQASVLTLELENSTLNLTALQIMDESSNATIKDSTINVSNSMECDNVLEVSKSNLNVKYIYINNTSNIKDSILETNTFFSDNSTTYEINFINTKINSTYFSGADETKLYFTGCDINATAFWPGSKMIFRDCTIDTKLLTSGYGFEIYDSTVRASGQFRTNTGSIVIENSTIDLTKSDTYNNTKFEAKTGLTIKDSTILLDGYMVSTSNATFDNSYIKIKTTHDADMLADNGYDYSTNSSLSVGGILTLTNSRVVLESSGIVPSLGVKGSVIIKDDYSKFKDINGKELDIVKVTVSSDNFLKNTYGSSRIQYIDVTGDSFYTSGEEVYTLSENGNISTNSYINAYKEYKFKIVNGTWSNNSTNEIVQKVLLGENVTYPTGMIANQNYANGKWSKTGDYEYTYTYEKIENPKTGIRSLSLLIGIVIIGILILSINENTFRKFKKI